MLEEELNPGPPKHRITKQLLYLLCYGSFKGVQKFNLFMKFKPKVGN